MVDNANSRETGAGKMLSVAGVEKTTSWRQRGYCSLCSAKDQEIAVESSRCGVWTSLIGRASGEMKISGSRTRLKIPAVKA